MVLRNSCIHCYLMMMFSTHIHDVFNCFTSPHAMKTTELTFEDHCPSILLSFFTYSWQCLSSTYFTHFAKCLSINALSECQLDARYPSTVVQSQQMPFMNDDPEIIEKCHIQSFRNCLFVFATGNPYFLVFWKF